MPLGRTARRMLEVGAAVAFVLLVGSLVSAAYLYRLSQTLPDIEAGQRALREGSENTIVYAADGSVLAEWRGDEDRIAIDIDQMPQHLLDAVVAIEDRRFWEHDGVDITGILRALSVNAGAGEVREGGSTITQQLVKLLYTGRERSLGRKVREALLAFELESRVGKRRVLEAYLNTVYFGNGAYGIESASRRYFGKRAAALDLPEAALLAGLIRAPVRYDPLSEPDAARRRRDLVLDAMAEQGYISAAELAAARAAPVALSPRRDSNVKAPYFVDYVKRELVERLGSERVFGGGLRVHTTLVPEVQRAAERAARTLSRPDDPEVALVAIRYRDGAVLAMVGGRDHTKNQFNLAVQGRRQPGSSFKPFVLVAALERGIRPDTVFDATPYTVRVKDGVWTVQNYENAKTSPRLTLQAATTWSVNAVYARLIMRIGPERVVAVARRLGITTPINPDPAIALGGLSTGVSPLEMAVAYGTLANGGLRVRPSGIARVTDARGRLLYEPDRRARQVVRRPVAVQTALMLHEVVERGTGTAADIGTWAAGKTGTTQSYRDAWFVGWAGDVVTAVWVGYPQAQIDMTDVHGIKVTGGSFPARIWARFMKAVTAVRSAPVRPPGGGTGQVLVTICQDSMKLANSRCPSPVEIYLAPSLVPQETCTLH